MVHETTNELAARQLEGRRAIEQPADNAAYAQHERERKAARKKAEEEEAEYLLTLAVSFKVHLKRTSATAVRKVRDEYLSWLGSAAVQVGGCESAWACPAALARPPLPMALPMTPPCVR